MPEIQNIDYRKLGFDAENPRLPEHLRGAAPEELVKYYYEHSVVSDLVESMAENGFFPHEPMIVTPRGRNNFTVVEGNRRLTALSIIHHRPEAVELPAPEPALTAEQVRNLKDVPCVVSEDREAIRRFLGFRHISGPLTWDPEAKARFLFEEIERAAGQDEEEPFLFVARAVGSKAQAVRGSYVAIKLLWLARDNGGVDIAQVQSSRFGVWLRLMSSPEFRRYINLERPNEYRQLELAFGQVNLEALAEVLNDLKAPAGGLPLLRDSRDATSYGRVLTNETARKVLRETGDLEAAKTIIDRENLPDRVRGEARRVDALASEVKITPYSKDLEQASKQLATAASAVLKLAKPGDLDDLPTPGR
jgi:hypothetical protein